MGKQVEFFTFEADEFEVLNMIIKDGGVIINKYLEQVKINEINENIHTCYIVFPMSRIVKSKGGFVDEIDSEVIQYCRCPKIVERSLGSGRIWAEFKFYNQSNEIVTKEEWFVEKFNLYAKWIKKNYKLSKCKHYYIGRYTYEQFYKLGYTMKAGPKNIIEF